MGLAQLVHEPLPEPGPAVLEHNGAGAERRARGEMRPAPRADVISTPTAGMLWFGGWLFTIAVAQLGFWKAVLALFIWPYFLGMLAR